MSRPAGKPTTLLMEILMEYYIYCESKKGNNN